jgi:hypothetical protein
LVIHAEGEAVEPSVVFHRSHAHVESRRSEKFFVEVPIGETHASIEGDSHFLGVEIIAVFREKGYPIVGYVLFGTLVVDEMYPREVCGE